LGIYSLVTLMADRLIKNEIRPVRAAQFFDVVFAAAIGVERA
jgi:hypothetical protein